MDVLSKLEPSLPGVWSETARSELLATLASVRRTFNSAMLMVQMNT